MVLTVLKSIREGFETREFGWLVLAMAAGILAAVGAGQISGQEQMGRGSTDLSRNLLEITAASPSAAGQNTAEVGGGSGVAREYNFDFVRANGAPEPAAIILAGAGIGLGLLVRRSGSRRRERANRWENSCREPISTEMRGRIAGTSPGVFGDHVGSERRA
jgi:hypothetical protein